MLAFKPVGDGETETSLTSWRFEEVKVREALSFWLIVDELPLKTVENNGFRRFISISLPMFRVPSRMTITRDIYNMYIDEKKNLKDFIAKNAQRVSITTDTWTSLQRVIYMCLTAHFIDDNWKLQKRILNFCPISGHKSEDIGKALEKCLIDWGIGNVFSITVDNASSNDGAISYLKKKFEDRGANLMGGKYLHMRCMAHIINLIVQDGLRDKDEHQAISRIRGAIRYIRGSPLRYKKFKECVALQNVESKKLLCLDVSTRWNSTYLMLESVLALKGAFEAYEEVDIFYACEISKCEGVPEEADWKRAEMLLQFLSHFYKLTLSISATLHITCDSVLAQINDVDVLLKQRLGSGDDELKKMSTAMKLKFDKYWGSLEKMNEILFFASILDPTLKFPFIEYSLDSMNGEKSESMKVSVKSDLQELFDAYKVIAESSAPALRSSSSASTSVSKEVGIGGNFRDQFRSNYKSGANRPLGVKSELEKYLSEEIEDESENFDLLSWWKVSSPRYPILSRMARDILAVPVSTVASESTFSSGGRVLDAFRSSLSPRIVQSLICVQDWLRQGSQINVEEDLYDIETLDQELKELALDSTPVDV